MERPTPELQRARDLVLKFGWNAVAYQILNPGITLWFSSCCEAVIGYSQWGWVRVVAGAPVCAWEELASVVEEFEKSAKEAHCRVCYFAAGHRMEHLISQRPRYSRIRIGAQPIWNPEQWPTILHGHPSLRAQLNRARNKNVSVAEWPPETAEKSPEIRQCLEEWLRHKPIPSMHFLVEPQTLARLWDRRVFVALRGDKAVGFLVASPIPQRQGWLIEQIIRGPAAPNGTAELMLDAAFHTARRENLEYLTLGLAPLSHMPDHSNRESPWWLNILFNWTRLHGSRFYNFQGLEHFKAKFQPMEWEPIFVLCDPPYFSTRILLAIVAVFGGRMPLLFLLRAFATAVLQEFYWLTGRKMR